MSLIYRGRKVESTNEAAKATAVQGTYRGATVSLRQNAQSTSQFSVDRQYRGINY